MASNTARFGLLKKDPATDGNDTFNIQTMLNDNWDKLDDAAKKSELDDHTSDTNIHVTPIEKTTWNNSEANAKAYTDSAPEAMQRNLGQFLTYRSGKDAKGVFTTVDYKRLDGTLYAKSVLSNADTNGNYQTRTITYYATDGSTVIRTDIWALTYDADGDLVSEVKS